MRILALSNLFPRPDQPQRGMFNAQLFEAMAELQQESGVRSPAFADPPALPERERAGASAGRQEAEGRRETTDNLTTEQPGNLVAVCLVPEWRVWRWPAIRKWKMCGGKGVSECGREEVREYRDVGVSGFAQGLRRDTWGCRSEMDEGRDRGSALIAHRSSFTALYVPVFYLPMVGRSVSWWTYGWTMRRLREMADDCDVVFSTWLYPDGVAATRLAESCGKPSWILVQGSDTFHLEHPVRRRAILAACAQAAGIVCVGQGLADRLVAAGVEKEKIHVAPNGVDADLFRFRRRDEALSLIPEARSQKSGVRIDRKLVLFVGNLVPVKGPDILLDAFAAVVRHLSSVLLLIGAGPMRGQLERQTRDLGIADSVVFLGSRPHAEVALWMNMADCLCLPSRAEGMPNVVLEALASGLPVVATDVGAVPEMLAGEPGARVVGTGVRSQESGGRGQRTDDRGQRAEAGHSATWQPNNLTTEQLVPRLAAALADVLAAPIDRAAMAERNGKLRSWNQMAEGILSRMEPGRTGEGETMSVR